MVHTINAFLPLLRVAAASGNGQAKVITLSSGLADIDFTLAAELAMAAPYSVSKAALNMVGKLLSFDVKDKGIAVAMVHPGFMRTEMTRAVGFDKFWDDGGGKTGPFLSMMD